MRRAPAPKLLPVECRQRYVLSSERDKRAEAPSVCVLTLVFGLECELGFRVLTGHMLAEE